MSFQYDTSLAAVTRHNLGDTLGKRPLRQVPALNLPRGGYMGGENAEQLKTSSRSRSQWNDPDR